MMENWRIYQDAHGEWRWWQLNDTGDIVAASETGHDNREACEQDAEQFGYQGFKD